MADWSTRGIGEAGFEQLAKGLSGSELQSLLLEVMRRRANARRPAEVLAQYQRDGFTRPAAVDLRRSLTIDLDLLAAAADFESIELSPVAPLATCSAVALTDQNRVLSSLRATEIVSDPTNVLALECAARLRAGRAPLDFATSQRVVRAQPPPQKGPGYANHFRLFVLASGGIESEGHGFTIDRIVRHVRALLGGLDRLEDHGYAFGARRVEILATATRAEVGDRIAAALGGVEVARKPLDHAYYSGGLRYMLWVTAPDGEAIPLGDGGSFDWLAQLTSNRRAVYVASGLGAQLIGARFPCSRADGA